MWESGWGLRAEAGRAGPAEWTQGPGVGGVHNSRDSRQLTVSFSAQVLLTYLPEQPS